MTFQAPPQREQGKRFYPWRGENYYSVTTIIEGGLRRRAFEFSGPKKVAEGVVRDRAVIRTMLDGCQSPEQCVAVSDPIDLCPRCYQTIRFLKDLAYSPTAHAADIGTAVHTAIDAYTRGKPMPPWPAMIRPRMAQFERLLADWSPTFELSEATVYSRRFGYAGTLDAILTIPLERLTEIVAVSLGWSTDGQVVRLLGDYKTSQRGIYPEIALQLAAYRYADFVGLPDGSEAGIPPVDGAVGINLTDDGYRLVPVVADDRIWRSFLHLRDVFRFADDYSKHVLGGDLMPAAVQAEIVEATA